MVYYLDGDFRLHTVQNADETLTPWTDAGGWFDGKCRAYVEGFRVIPAGQTWTRGDGVQFTGPTIAPVQDGVTLAAIQSAYEQGLAENAQMAVDHEYRLMLLELGAANA